MAYGDSWASRAFEDKPQSKEKKSEGKPETQSKEAPENQPKNLDKDPTSIVTRDAQEAGATGSTPSVINGREKRSDVRDRLKILQNLLDEKLISESEFQEKRKSILDSI